MEKTFQIVIDPMTCAHLVGLASRFTGLSRVEASGRVTTGEFPMVTLYAQAWFGERCITTSAPNVALLVTKFAQSLRLAFPEYVSHQVKEAA